MEQDGLYVYRPVINGHQIYQWTVENKIPNPVPPHKLHITQVYSRKPVKLDHLKANFVRVENDSKRTVEPLGDEGALVLKFYSPELQERFKETLAQGASYDYPNYQSHVTLSYDAGNYKSERDLKCPHPIILGPEISEPLEESWAEKNNLRATSK